MLSNRRDSVIEFLLTAVATATGEKYKAAASDFKLELERRGVSWDALDGEEQDWTLAEYLVEGYYSERTRPWGVTLASSLQKIAPSRRLKTAWKVLDTWAIHSPTQQALPCPKELALACSVLLVARGSWMEGTAVLLCFVGLLRISEALKLKISDVFFSTEATRLVVILVLSQTKRGRDQRVVIANAEVVAWLRVVLHRRESEGARKDMLLLPTSYKKVATSFSKACTLLQVPGHWTTHSLRRGGATEMLIQQYSLETIMEFGRWASVSSARLYLRRGEVALLRCRGDFTDEVVARLAALSAVGSSIWRLCKLLHS